MKFGKNLQRVIDITDPAWSPYWLGYKFLKKLIKNLMTAEEVKSQAGATASDDSDASTVDDASKARNEKKRCQQGGDTTQENVSAKRPRHTVSSSSQLQTNCPSNNDAATPPIGQSPGEVAFFKYLHAELKKAEWFFERAVREHEIRLERVRKGMQITKKLKILSSMDEKWKTVSKAMYLLYRDLLLLETYAILTYVGFSKILKKHDKVTGYRTCNAYMESIVNQSNFADYPKLMSMISGCDRLYEEISGILEQERQKLLSDDEKLFISMIQEWNEEVLGDDGRRCGSSSRPSPNVDSTDTDPSSPAVGDLRELLFQNEESSGIALAASRDQPEKLVPAKR